MTLLVMTIGFPTVFIMGGFDYKKIKNLTFAERESRDNHPLSWM
jgi:hypothetical protein